MSRHLMIVLGVALAYSLLSLAVGLFIAAFIKAGAGRRPAAPESPAQASLPEAVGSGGHTSFRTGATVKQFPATGPIGLLRTRFVEMKRHHNRS